jgi:hypothetical protein
VKLIDPVTNWSFECLTDSSGKPQPGGVVLQELRHDGHNLAKDVRVIGFWLTIETVDPSGTVASTANQFYTLDSTNFTLSTVSTLIPKPITHPVYGKTFRYLKEADAVLNFTEYFMAPGDNYVAYGVTAKFEAPALLNSQPNCEFAGITIEQIFLFSRYGNSPKHEPSGGLLAARFHPMVRYAFTKNASFDDSKRHSRIASIRFDYRLHLFLDRHYDLATNVALAQIGNQAGLFADSDSAGGTVATSVGSAVWNILKSPYFLPPKNTNATALSRGLFEAVEKPLVLEVMAPGLEKGFPAFATTTTSGTPLSIRSWDNIHWWGSRGPGAPLISAPGAFHAAHVHWRWGGTAATAGVSSDPHFNPQTWPRGIRLPSPPSGMWGPLVDPGIWIQSLRIAVTKNDARLDPARGAPLANLSKAHWKSLFNPGLRSVPADISAGDDIVLWYSAEVYREITIQAPSIQGTAPTFAVPLPPTYRSASSGTIFIHGLFFAHDAEKTGFQVGSTDPAYRPTDEASIRSAKSWFRAAG